MSDFSSWKKIKDKKILKRLNNLTEKEKIDNFSNSLNFGTAGMRGEMIVGSGGINEVTVAKLASATSKYMLSHKKTVAVVCYDTRYNSKTFAHIFAKILSNNSILVYLFKQFAPTPLCIFATREKKADIGIMITASHNRRNFNGIKIINSVGIQIDDDVQEEISKNFNDIDEVENYNATYKQKLNNIKWIKDEVLHDYLKADTDITKKTLKIVYTPLNGTGLKAVTQILKNNNFKYHIPKCQKHRDPDFTTCPYPNPEFKEAFNESLKLAKKVDADLIIATDPDADRLGMMIKTGHTYKKLSGNEVGYIFLKYLAQNFKTQNSFVVTSVVSSPLVDEICEKENLKLYKTLTGFKSLGEKTHEECQKGNVPLLVFEESCGYVVRKNTFDKESIFAALLICKIAQWLKDHNSTLDKYLTDIYREYGYMVTLGDSITFEGVDSLKKMNDVVESLRKKPIKNIDGHKIEKTVDYLKDDTGLKKQNFIEYHAGNLRFIIRPSGTEPKLKIYLFYKDNNSVVANEEANKVLESLKKMLNER